LVYPASADLVTFAVILAVGLPSIFLFSKFLKLNPQKVDFTNKMRESRLGFAVFVAVFIVAFGIYDFYDKVWVRATLTADPIYVLRGAIAAALILVPLLVALKYSKLGPKSFGLTKSNLGESLGLGLLVSSVLVLVLGDISPRLGGGFVGISGPMGYQLLSFLIAGFSEEIIFRGYIQSRLTARAGAFFGIVVGSFFYAAYNFVLGYFCFSGNIGLAAAYGGLRFSPGVVYGYTFHKSQNVLSSSILHSLLVWGGLLFGLYL